MTNGLGPARNFCVRVTINCSGIVRVRNFAEFDRSTGRSRRSEVHEPKVTSWSQSVCHNKLTTSSQQNHKLNSLFQSLCHISEYVL